jgi:hypothetical protein
LYRANYTFRAVELPAGEHEVVFRFEPASFWWGGRLSLLSLGCVLLLLAATTVARWQPSRSEATPRARTLFTSPDRQGGALAGALAQPLPHGRG